RFITQSTHGVHAAGSATHPTNRRQTGYTPPGDIAEPGSSRGNDRQCTLCQPSTQGHLLLQEPRRNDPRPRALDHPSCGGPAFQTCLNTRVRPHGRTSKSWLVCSMKPAFNTRSSAAMPSLRMDSTVFRKTSTFWSTQTLITRDAGCSHQVTCPIMRLANSRLTLTGLPATLHMRCASMTKLRST